MPDSVQTTFAADCRVENFWGMSGKWPLTEYPDAAWADDEADDA